VGHRPAGRGGARGAGGQARRRDALRPALALAALLGCLSAHALASREDSSPAAPLDSLPPASSPSASTAIEDYVSTPPPRLSLSSGLDIEGEEQSFGLSSWFDPAGSIDPTAEDLEPLRYDDRNTEALAVFGFEARPGGASAGSPRFELESRWGERRRALWGEGEAAWDSGPFRGLSLRNHLQIEDEREDRAGTQRARLSFGQELLHVRWKRPIGRTGVSAVGRGSLDLSWAGGEAVETDSLAALYAFFLDYRKAGAGLGLTTGGASGGSMYFDFAAKRTDLGRTGSYDAGSLELLYNGFARAGFWTLDLRGERRRYLEADAEEHSSSLRSYWSAELKGDWQRLFAPLEIETGFQASATRYDPPAVDDTLDAGIEGLGSLNADRLRLQADVLFAHDFLSVTDPDALLRLMETAPSDRLASLRCGVGATAERLWLDEATGEYHSLGGRFEVEARGGEGLGEVWIELALLAGKRDYRGDGEGLVFDAGGLSFSFAQTDYDFLELSLIGGGRLPGSLEWQLHAFLDRELHSAGEDDARLSSITLALRRSWALLR